MRFHSTVDGVNKKAAHHSSHHTKHHAEYQHHSHVGSKIVKIIGSLYILGVLAYPMLFYVTQGIAYLPSWQYVLAALVTAIILIYSYFLIISIHSAGKIVVVFVLFLSTILISSVLFGYFTPIMDFVIAKFTNSILCERIPMFTKGMNPQAVNAVQNTCQDLAYKIFFKAN